ncbi:putative membrane protein [Litoreibacter meonggei]|uniref:Putative membrane protein n=1 Tax=Litoreibacter meonggei TaxID=1049199 RepID=A0A497X4B0_9RHOB|nr:putative membrane protein [Litoreibacter meonggei]
MIIKEQPSGLTLFVEMQGSIVPQILSKIAGFTVFSSAIMALDTRLVFIPHVSLTAMSVFGIALSLFLGFRNNAAYDRWWEGRKLWGGIIADVRNLAKTCEIFVPDIKDRKDILDVVVAFAHFHRGMLRGVDASKDAANWIGVANAATLAGKSNSTDGALRVISEQIRHLHAQGAINDFGQISIGKIITSLGLHQAGCERIATTPLPFVYSLLVRRTTYLYCLLLPFALLEVAGPLLPFFVAVVAYVFFGLQAVTNELEHPFRMVKNGLPLDAMCRVVEISVSEATDREPPPALSATNHVLS